MSTVAYSSVVPLFDRSGGHGELPGDWPRATFAEADFDGGEHAVYHGYAGGLGPHTLAEQLPRIAEAAGNARVWIDMETRVPSDDDRVFDLVKARRFLEIAEPWVAGRAAKA